MRILSKGTKSLDRLRGHPQFRTVGRGFRYRISLLYQKSLFFTPNASENASRTTGSLFEHGTHIPYRRSLFLVPSAIVPRFKYKAGKE
mgnify:CR=1 FL=1